MKKQKYLFILVINIIIILFNCSFYKSKKITFWAMPNAPNDVHTEWMEKKAIEFNNKTSVTVIFEEKEWGDAWSSINQALESGEGADVFQVGTTWNPQFAATGSLLELDIREFAYEKEFFESSLVSCTYKNKYYGIPWFSETRCLFFNKDIFYDIGIKPPKTYNELIIVCSKIIEKNGKGSAIEIASTTDWDFLHNWAIILWANGGDILNEDFSKAVFNSQVGVDAMKFYVDIIRNEFAIDTCSLYSQPQADAAFINGNVAMQFMGPWNVIGIKNDNPDLNYGVVEPPQGSAGKASFSGGSNLVVLNTTEAKKAAKAWIKYLIDEKNLIDYTKNLSKMLPAKVNAFKDPYYQTDEFKVFKNTLEYSKAYPPIAVWGSIETAIVDEFKNIIADYINGSYTDETCQKYLDKGAEKVNAELAEEK